MAAPMESSQNSNSVISSLTEPMVFKDCINNWSLAGSDIRDLATILRKRKIRFRVGEKIDNKTHVQFEGDCQYVEATMEDFCEWCRERGTEGPHLTSSTTITSTSSTKLSTSTTTFSSSSSSSSSSASKHDATPLSNHHSENPELAEHGGPTKLTPETESCLNPLMTFDPRSHWCYADYKYMVDLFADQPEILESVKWEDLGFPDHDGRHSTIWIGSGGASTPCHQDSYGFNLVAQIAGRKRWHLFPPSQTALLYPTRLPYEESSVFSQVNVRHPDLTSHPRFGRATPHAVVLGPGDVLFVPKHWWHFVECLDVAISINCWVDVGSDHISRVDEAITRAVVCGLMSNKDRSDEEEEDDDERVSRPSEKHGSLSWLNPTEEATNTITNIKYIQAATEAATAYLCRTPTPCRTPAPCRTPPPCRTPGGSGLEIGRVLQDGGSGLPQTGLRDSERTGDGRDSSRPVDNGSGDINNDFQTYGEDSDDVKKESQDRTRSDERFLSGTDDPGSSNVFKDAASQYVKRPCDCLEDAQYGDNSSKRRRAVAMVTLPGSRMQFERQSVVAVPCLGPVGKLTLSSAANDSANVKLDHEPNPPRGSALTAQESTPNVSMATLVECLTHPEIISSVRQLLLDKVLNA